MRASRSSSVDSLIDLTFVGSFFFPFILLPGTFFVGDFVEAASVGTKGVVNVAASFSSYTYPSIRGVITFYVTDCADSGTLYMIFNCLVNLAKISSTVG